VRVAALYDIHANAVALRAVLADVEREGGGQARRGVAWSGRPYDVRAAEAELRGGGWPGVDDFLRNSFLEPTDPLVVARALERQAEGI
jgi:hypothetical protein